MPSFKGDALSEAQDQVHRDLRRDRVANGGTDTQCAGLAGDACRACKGITRPADVRDARRARSSGSTRVVVRGDTARVRFFVGITGASGAPYAARLLDGLRDAGAEIGVCASASAGEVIAYEIYRDRALDPVAAVRAPGATSTAARTRRCTASATGSRPTRPARRSATAT